MGKLTPALIKELTEPGRYSDGEGLLLRISPSGEKSWLMRVQVNGAVGTSAWANCGM